MFALGNACKYLLVGSNYFRVGIDVSWGKKKINKRLILYLSKVAHPARAYPSLNSIKQPWVLSLPPPGGNASPYQGVHFLGLLWQFSKTHICSREERGTVRGKCFAQEHNTLTWPCVKPGLLKLESSALLTIISGIDVSLSNMLFWSYVGKKNKTDYHTLLN